MPCSFRNRLWIAIHLEMQIIQARRGSASLTFACRVLHGLGAELFGFLRAGMTKRNHLQGPLLTLAQMILGFFTEGGTETLPQRATSTERIITPWKLSFRYYGQRITPCAHRHPPQARPVLPKQSSALSVESSQPLQKVQGEKSKRCTRSRRSA